MKLWELWETLIALYGKNYKPAEETNLHPSFLYDTNRNALSLKAIVILRYRRHILGGDRS